MEIQLIEFVFRILYDFVRWAEYGKQYPSKCVNESGGNENSWPALGHF